MMDKETREKLVKAGREDLVKVFDINSSGYAGILPSGMIVDRREYPNAIPVQENELLGIPKPKKIDS